MVLNAIPRYMGSALHTLQIEPARIRAAARRMQVLRLGGLIFFGLIFLSPLDLPDPLDQDHHDPDQGRNDGFNHGIFLLMFRHQILLAVFSGPSALCAENDRKAPCCLPTIIRL